jgi:hypothetical protein
VRGLATAASLVPIGQAAKKITKQNSRHAEAARLAPAFFESVAFTGSAMAVVILLIGSTGYPKSAPGSGSAAATNHFAAVTDVIAAVTAHFAAIVQ